MLFQQLKACLNLSFIRAALAHRAALAQRSLYDQFASLLLMVDGYKVVQNRVKLSGYNLA